MILTAVLALAQCGLLIAPAAGQENNWGKWGPNDQIGTLNYITPETIRHAAGLVRQGKVISLGVPIDPEGPCGTGGYGKIYRYMISTA